MTRQRKATIKKLSSRTRKKTQGTRKLAEDTASGQMLRCQNCPTVTTEKTGDIGEIRSKG